MPTTTKTKRRKTKAELEREFLGTTKLWKLLKIALADFAACERSKRFEIDMGAWISQNGKCRVCLAGACMVRHGINANKFWDSNDKNYDQIENRAFALNSLRAGSVGTALWELSDGMIKNSDHTLTRSIVDYDEDQTRWWADMRRLLADLRKANI